MSQLMALDSQMRVPLSIGAIHFIGIGGIGMSGIAEVMKNLGYQVQGSDSAESANVKRLRDSGIAVAIGQRAENLGDAQVVVYSSAVKPDNPEFAAARAGGAADRSARGDAGRADAAEALRRHRRDPRQDHDHHHGGGAARCRRARSDGGEWRHHQRLRHQCAAGCGRMDGGGGGRIRRHLPEASGDGRHRHQCRSRASRFLRRFRSRARRIPELSSRTFPSTVSA